jgi:hypothetical protein
MMARDVFQKSLPSWRRIKITDALGLYDRPFTANEMGLYFINAGPEVYDDAALAKDYTEIVAVVDVTDHPAGPDPFYTAAKR